MRIFISYRRGNTSALAGRLDDRLRAQFGPDAVFRDVDNIPAGVDFHDHLSAAVRACDVFLAVIGPDFFGKRIRNTDDFVRIEVEAALTQKKVVIPVLVGDAKLPKASQVPPTVAPLLRRQAALVDVDRRFNDGVHRLIRDIEQALQRPPPIGANRIASVAPRSVPVATLPGPPPSSPLPPSRATARFGTPTARPYSRPAAPALKASGPGRRAIRLMPMGLALGAIAIVTTGVVLRMQSKPPVVPQDPLRGILQVDASPTDATIWLDNTELGHSGSVFPPAGKYSLSVRLPGYVTRTQKIDVEAGKTTSLTVKLEPSPDTGFEVSSEPSGIPIWLDGRGLTNPDGPARTDFRAAGITPGRHVLELKGDNRFQPWRQEINVEADTIRSVHASLVPVAGPATQTGHNSTKMPRSALQAAGRPLSPMPEPDDADILIKRARDAWLKQQCGSAIDLARKALLARPGMTDAYQVIAICSCNLKDAEGATRAYGRLDDKSRNLVRSLCSRNGISLSAE